MSAPEVDTLRDPADWYASRSWRQRYALRRAMQRKREPPDRQTAATLAWLARREAWRSLWTNPGTIVAITLVLVVWPDADAGYLWGYALGWAVASSLTHGRLRRVHRRFADQPGRLPPWSLVALSGTATYLLPLLVVRLTQ